MMPPRPPIENNPPVPGGEGPPPWRASALRLLPRMVALAAAVAAVSLWVFPPSWLPPGTAGAAAMVVGAIGFWATGVLPEHVTAMLFFLGGMLLGVAPAGVLFSGFASPAWWLVLGGLLIGAAVRRTGLGQRIVHRLALRFEAGYAGIITGVVMVSVAVGFLMPSAMGRMTLLVPLALAFAERMGFPAGSNGRSGVILAAAFGGYAPTFAILTSNVPNMVLLGTASSLYGYAPGYGEYLWLHFPVLGLLKALALAGLIVVFFPDKTRARAAPPGPPGPMTRSEALLAGVLVLTLGLWATDFLHHISPAWVALGAGICCLLPPLGILPKEAFREDVNFGSLFFVAGVLGLGSLVSHTGLGDLLAAKLLEVLPMRAGAPAQNVAALAASSMAIGLVTTAPGVPAVLTPLAAKIAAVTGMPLKSILMAEVLGFSTTFLPYQAPPLVVAMHMAGEPMGKAVRLCLLLSAVTVVLLLPIDLLWWWALGRL